MWCLPKQKSILYMQNIDKLVLKISNPLYFKDVFIFNHMRMRSAATKIRHKPVSFILSIWNKHHDTQPNKLPNAIWAYTRHRFIQALRRILLQLDAFQKTQRVSKQNVTANTLLMNDLYNKLARSLLRLGPHHLPHIRD